MLATGLHRGVAEDAYFADPSLSRSDLHAIKQHSLAHWRAEKERRAEKGDAVNQAFVIGSASHVALLEPDTWRDRYTIVADVEKLDVTEPPPVEKIEDVTEPPPVEKSGVAGPVKGDDGAWRLPGETGETTYKTKAAAAAAAKPWRFGEQLFSKRTEAAEARKAAMAKVMRYSFGDRKFLARAEATEARKAALAKIMRYSWDGNTYPTRDDAELARVMAIGPRIVLSPGDATLARDMAGAMRAHARIGRCFEAGAGEAEVTVVTVIRGVRIRVRLDWLVTAEQADALDLDPSVRADHRADLCIDYKTSKDARPRAFGYSCLDYGYAMQAALYSDVYEAVTGRRLEWLFAVSEKRKPYGVRVYKPDAAFIEHGRQGYLAAIDTYRKAKKTGRFPAYPHEVLTLSLPYRARDDGDKAEARKAEARKGRAMVNKWREISAKRGK